MAQTCEGNIALLRFQEDVKRKPPYLIRNLRKSLNFLGMGSGTSKESGPEEDMERLSKRRKVSHFPPSASEGGYSARFERERPNSEFVPALRIDLLNVTANEVESVPEEEVSVPIIIRFRASIGIFYANSEDQVNKGRPSDYPELCRKTSTAKMRISKTANGKQIKREIEMQPFVFSCNELFVNRKKTFSREPTDFDESGYQTYELADHYRIQVSLERLGEEAVWPPIENHDWKTMSEEYFTRYSNSSCLEVKTLLPMSIAQQRKSPPIWIVHRSTKQVAPYALHLQTQWSIPNSIPRAPQRQEIPRRPLADISEQNVLRQAVMVQDAGERRSRNRKKVDYNVKRLSDEAIGKISPRKRKRKSETESVTGDEMADEITIAFSFGPADAAESGIPRQHNFKGLRCPLCDRNHSTFDLYRLHLQNDHGNFKFSLRRQNPSRYSFYVEVVASNSGDRVLKRTFQLGKPVTLFNLEKYLNGDNAWVTSRQGPMHNHWPDEYTSGNGEAVDSPFTSSSPVPSRRSSPNTSSRSNEDAGRSVDDAMDLDNVSKSLTNLNTHTRTRKVILVPKTAKPLFHTINKRQLKPGEELPSSEDEKDESWFLLKHRDMLNDFEDVDVSPAAKEYLNQWNAYATNHHHNVDVLIPNTVNGFIHEHMAWLPPRKQQFMAHMSILMLQGVVTERQVTQWVGILRQANANPREDNVDMEMEDGQDEQLVPKLRGVNDCICLEHVPLSPNRLMCVGKTCQNRYFHKSCLPNHPSVPKGKWKCNNCLDSASFSAYS